LPPVDATDVRDRFRFGNFRFGPAEKIGDRTAQRVDYDLFIKGQTQQNGDAMPLAVSLWIDPATRLLLKRTVKQNFGSMLVTETYGKVVVNGQIDSKAFELPKLTSDTIVEP
jgi:hypothetical protein